MSENQISINKIEGGRVEFAFKKVESAKVYLKEKAKEYRSLIEKLTTMLLTNGLGQTIAFIKAKAEIKNGNKNAYMIILEQIDEYFKANEIVGTIKKGNENLVKWIITKDTTEYKLIAQEIVSLFKWLKRFAQGLIARED